MGKVNNLEISNISRRSIYKVYREKTADMRNQEELNKKKNLSKKRRTH